MLKPNAGRALSAVGATLLLVSLALAWYHVERPSGVESASGWESFPRLRWIVAGGAALVLATALVRQTKLMLIARAVLGVVVAALILRRIIDPPDLSSPVVTQFGAYVGVAAALLAAFGGLVDTGRALVAPVMGLSRDPRPQLPAGGDPQPAGKFTRTPSGGATASRRS